MTEKDFLEKRPTDDLAHALKTGNCETIEDELNKVLEDSISCFDYHENFYHGMVLGLMSHMGFNRVKSNREYGDGRPDIVAIEHDLGILLELKCVTVKELEKALDENSDTRPRDVMEARMMTELDEAEFQIRNRRYVIEVMREIPELELVKTYALSFCRKRCLARLIE